jgi:hypothetical protein
MKSKNNDKTIQYTQSAPPRKVSYTWFACNSFKVNNTQKTSLIKSIPTLFMRLLRRYFLKETPKRPIL